MLSFLDTNVLIYVDDHDAPARQETAQKLLEEHLRAGTAVFSTQVLQEYFVNATRKLGVPAQIAQAKVEVYGRGHLAVVGLDDVMAAIDIHRLHGVSFWDSLILRSAVRTRCRVLFTEDLQAGRRFDGLQVVNPFAA